MRVVVDTPVVTAASTPARDLAALIAADTRADYVYSYPPRQSYRPLPPGPDADVPGLVSRSLARFPDLNLYAHVPFCRQICRFCNLYAVADAGRDDRHDDYVTAVLSEAERLAALTDRKHVTTLYLGGGTPSLLRPQLLERLVTGLLALFATDPATPPPETALEVDPATVDAAALRDIRAAGINRINLGYQSMVSAEVVDLGRDRPTTSGLDLLAAALGTGFANVCVDLIYGLAGQSDEGWLSSLRQVTALLPPTVCAYPLTLRPFTGYRRRGYRSVDGALLHRRYRVADRVLREAGYRQETHVRWVRDRGGYVQKANHWGMRNVLGVGAGARSYLWEADLRNGYSVRSRSSALRDYLDRVRAGQSPVRDGYRMTPDERLRKAAALNLMDLDRNWARELLGADPVERFADRYAAFAELGLAEVGPDRARLTAEGVQHRDLLSQTLFSPEVRTRLRAFDYDE
ncbi:coproporphyrinogen-III oxidase family protein [Actinosynnema mirum]|uniref:Heme chaperone HemW n=1 Tax=Actinosynnema mirum (strain ATCC 29888 / DSM 43827 / JCM 3225 / NBRC 14064 / NCIMB 13271 / NRRL B-12336 / IMRU 3971 / 101) TaxID=446462 RepID=C6WQL5_ACTMD|nr:radical SAM protein [Actinosynnema mirum]ACU38705.1 Coproporphyrinogen dehydrogenase [Actinosynnema mirum DSM 43827]